MSERQGIEVDYCPKCRGVWLDRGELDKLIERSAALPAQESGPRARDDDRYRGGHDERSRGSYKRKRGGFLGEIFDFD